MIRYRAIAPIWLACLIVLLLACSDQVEAEPWEFDDPGELEWGCLELEDWKADDQFEFTEVRDLDGRIITTYQRRLEPFVNDCGVFAMTMELHHYDEGETESIQMTNHLDLCNRCTEEAELVWIGDPHGRYEFGDELHAIIHFQERSIPDDELVWELDELQPHGDLFWNRLGPTVFWQLPGQDEFSTTDCRRNAFNDPPMIVRLTLGPHTHHRYLSSARHFFGERRNCDSVECPQFVHDTPDTLEDDAVRLSFGMPRIRSVGEPINWESATFLPDSACDEAGFEVLNEDGTFSGISLRPEAQVTEAHRAQHFIHHVEPLSVPPEIAEVWRQFLESE